MKSSSAVFRAVLALSIVCVFTGTARAQLFLEEGKVSLTVTGGDRINKTVTIHNSSSEEASVKVYWEDFQYQPPFDGTKLFLPAGTGERSLSQWVSFSPQQFTLPAYGKQQIEYSISVPSSVQGGYYGVLFFEKTLGPMADSTGVNIITRVGCLFFVEAADKDKTATIQDLVAKPTGLSGTFTNQGNVVLIPSTTYYIMDDKGMVADRGEFKKMYVAPKGNASWSLDIPASLKVGQYSMLITADLGDGDAVVKELKLSKDGAGALEITNVRD